MGQTVLSTEDRPDVSIPCPRVCRFRLVFLTEEDQLNVDWAKRLRSTLPGAILDTSNLELRGLFARPQQVLYYVVDMVGTDS
jgi:hypothetical protein